MHRLSKKSKIKRKMEVLMERAPVRNNSKRRNARSRVIPIEIIKNYFKADAMLQMHVREY
jgi:hypothetical protein